MRITCEVLVCRRQPASPCCKGQSHQASLSIGWESGGSAVPSNTFLYLCPPKTRKYTKYKVAGNVEKLCTRLVSEGKFIIYFKEPEENLYVRAADPLLARNFMQTLKAVLANRDLDKLQPFNLEDARPRKPNLPKDELTITTREEYPTTENFPHLLRRLKINKVRVCQLDPRILDLSYLQSLDMSMNILNILPADLGKMAALTHLQLGHNELADIPPEVFTGTLRNTLNSLDLSHNFLKDLPGTLSRLCKLESLILTGNRIVSLPLNIGKLTSLRLLRLEDNNLMELPASMCHLKLNLLKELRNPMKRQLGVVEDRLASAVGPLCLKELAAHTCVKGKQKELDIPVTLQNYLLDYQLCLCGQPCFESYILACIPLRLQTQVVIPWSFNLKVLEQDSGCEGGEEKCLLTSVVPALATFCSHRCWKKAMNRQTRASMLIVESGPRW